MTKEITKAFILQQIEDRFQLRELVPEKFTFSENVIPIYDIAPHLGEWESSWASVSITSATSFSIVTVPQTERWMLRSYSPIFMTGVFTVAGVYVLRKKRRDTTDFTYLDLEAAQSTSYLRVLPEAVVLEAGDEIRVNVDGWTSIGTLKTMYDFRRETLR